MFAQVMGTRERKALYDVFISDGVVTTIDFNKHEIPLEIHSSLNNWVEEYDTIVHEKNFNATLNRLRDLEIAILMYRSSVSPTISIGEMKLRRNGSEKSYAFVRAPFFAPDNVKNEIRVYMGTIEELGKSIEELKKDANFLDRCEHAVIEAMTHKLKEHIQKMNKN